ncbi:carboxymuconolactone decarboxylase family protein [Balneolaceae bacterium YR4-1]|uniref:Carboxymuconolactone decarboxylase family protein n=1 Tax=Halalkalibaculum roseum TaxID=2709311 RepID=A0A6M1T006_9BACT|nr:carboxymuconolactone decarboxylase family protein [Halalkalibaculum roseum]NGP77998.1 carboxymuconolactone decarboxylase family protein [Halalkalibaculum roseum]
MNFTIYTTENAPEESKPLLDAAKDKFGFLPNLLGEFAESPALLEGYLQLNDIVGKTSFSEIEQQLAILAVSVENKCHYCTAVHSTILKNQLNVDESVVESVRKEETLVNPKLNTLVSFVRKVVAERGFISENDLESFLEAGYTKQQALEVNLIVALKTISNYTNHLADTPLDEAFQPDKLEFATA